MTNSEDISWVNWSFMTLQHYGGIGAAHWKANLKLQSPETNKHFGKI